MNMTRAVEMSIQAVSPLSTSFCWYLGFGSEAFAASAGLAASLAGGSAATRVLLATKMAARTASKARRCFNGVPPGGDIGPHAVRTSSGERRRDTGDQPEWQVGCRALSGTRNHPKWNAKEKMRFIDLDRQSAERA